jgi:seryl-tRNA synthetase
MASLRGTQQPELSKKLFKIIKSENHAIGAYEAAARERLGIAQQLSEWGEATEDETISEISDKLGVLLAEIAEQEDLYAQALEEYRGILKQIRNTESSVQPSRDHKTKVWLGATVGVFYIDQSIGVGRDRQAEIQRTSKY